MKNKKLNWCHYNSLQSIFPSSFFSIKVIFFLRRTKCMHGVIPLSLLTHSHLYFSVSFFRVFLLIKKILYTGSNFDFLFVWGNFFGTSYHSNSQKIYLMKDIMLLFREISNFLKLFIQFHFWRRVVHVLSFFLPVLFFLCLALWSHFANFSLTLI